MQPYLNVVFLLENLRCADDQTVHIGHVAADPVRNSAGRIRRIAAAFERDNFQLVGIAQPPGLRGGAHSTGVAADDDEPFPIHEAELNKAGADNAKTLPGLKIPCGSSAALIARCTHNDTGPTSRSSQSTFNDPTPCSPVIVPPRDNPNSKIRPNASYAFAFAASSVGSKTTV